MFKSILAQQLHKQFLRQVGVGTARALLNQQSGIARSTHQWMVRDDAMKFGPKPADV
jgi:hypothetical protein